MMWCGGCYTLSPLVTFHVNQLKKERGESKKDPRDQEMVGAKAWGKVHQSTGNFLKARDGDHTMVQFECTLCILKT